MSSPSRRLRAEEIFCAVIDLASLPREDAIREACRDDEALRDEVQALIAGYQRTESTFPNTVNDVASEFLLDLAAEDDLSGQSLGAYTIEERVGEGGVGTVYRARRSDDSLHPAVAIKVLKRGMNSVDLLRRFAAEMRILGNLSHPSIATIYDAGMTAESRPYFVMEFVDGAPIDVYCRDNSLSTEQRLELFLQLLDAVDGAHRNLIVHRDLKPANIMVTESGTPKLLDFGLAKVLDPDNPIDDQTSPLERRLTLRYASPEQLEGQPATTVADVYSLGVVLYELLTGRSPYGSIESKGDLFQLIKAQTPPRRPSTVASDPSMGDLDWVLLRALEFDPARRYGSARALGDDLERVLNHHAVTARPPSRRYRLGKLIRRHRGGFTAAALFVLLVIVSFATITTLLVKSNRLALREQAAHDRATDQFEQLHRLVQKLLFDFDEDLREIPGSTVARRNLVSTALEYLGSLREDASDDATLRFELALAYRSIGDIQGHPRRPNLGDTSGALASYARSETILRELLRSQPSRSQYELSLAQTLLRRCLLRSGDKEEASTIRAFLDEAEKLTYAVASTPQDGEAARHLLSRISSERARLHTDEDEFALAEVQLRNCRDLLLQLSADFPGKGEYLGEIASLDVSRGRALVKAGQSVDGLALLQQAAERFENLTAEGMAERRRCRNLAVCRGHVATVLVELGRLSEALQWAESSRTAALTAVSFDRFDREARARLASKTYSVGVIHQRLKDYPAALELYRESLAERKLLIDLDPETRANHDKLFRLEVRIADTLVKLEQLEEAGKQFTGALQTLNAIQRRFSDNTKGQERAWLLSKRAKLWARAGNDEAAIKDHEEVCTLVEARFSRDPRETRMAAYTIGSYDEYADALERAGRLEEALSARERSVDVSRGFQGPSSSLLSAFECNALHGMAELLLRLERAPEALDALLAIRPKLDALLGVRTEDADLLHMDAWTHQKTGELRLERVSAEHSRDPESRNARERDLELSLGSFETAARVYQLLSDSGRLNQEGEQDRASLYELVERANALRTQDAGSPR